jgi:hypothetical protein
MNQPDPLPLASSDRGRFRQLPGCPVTEGFTETRPLFALFPLISQQKGWRRRSESNDVFTDCQPQYPDLQSYFNMDSKGLQEVFTTTRHLPALTRNAPTAYSVIEEIVEGFVEGFLHGIA